MNKSRFERGQVVATTSEIRKISHSCLIKVESQSVKGKFYNVVLRADGLSCDCPDFTVRQEVCKHCWAVIISTAGAEEKY